MIPGREGEVMEEHPLGMTGFSPPSHPAGVLLS
ncbi:MAG: hypothetical protein HW375_884 [Anaerolineales bacterium]|nr:hypothetical protein [Anaerolineales bacterium]